QLKSNFFANVSHELRTPLTLLLGPIGSVLKSGDLDQRNFSLLQKAQQSGKELLKMVSSILDLSKLEAQKMEVDWQPVLLFPLVRRISTNFESQAEIKQIQYTFNYRAEGDLFVEIDQEKLSIFLKNLLSNAIKFTPANGKVRMIVEDLGNKIQFTVKDTGRGIPDEDVAHVFDRFYQTKQANKAVEGGTGIGLALCKEYTQLMGGDITVKSQLNIGSTFIATIARREVLQATPNMVDMESSDILTPSSLAPKVNPSNHTATSILVVEDNSSLRDYLYTILSPHYRVSLAENGVKALAFLQESKEIDLPKLILSDIMMPEMDGYQLLEILKSKEKFRALPTIMLTARADAQDKLKALRIGVDDYILKPFEEEELLVRIQNLLSNYQVRSETTKLISEHNQSTENTSSISQEDQAWLAEVESHLQKQLSNSSYSILQLSFDIALSERQLRRRLKQLVGLSPSQYFKLIRLQNARQLLEQKRYKTVSQTAAAVGFQDTGAFSRNFTKQFGRKPSEYINT
ncbi:MAG: ATP-binding protein, partial [Bacteroidota bacterium]